MRGDQQALIEKDREQPRLLAVFAHPDDETFGPGGTLALYARRGVQVHLICATRGEAGDLPDSLRYQEADIAQLREAELRCAAYHLGLTRVSFLNYRDSGMPGSADNHHPRALCAAPTNQVAAEIVHFIREIRPQVVITFDPQGTYHHPDHIAIHRATVQAFHATGEPEIHADRLPPYQPLKLYYSTISTKMLRLLIALMRLLGKNPRQWGRNKDVDLVAVAGQAYPIHAQVKIGSVLRIRDRAIACHASQLEAGLRRPGLLGWLFRLVSQRDSFMRAHPPASENLKEDDLFAGVSLKTAVAHDPRPRFDQAQQ